MRYWNLETNKFLSLEEANIDISECVAVRNLEGKIVYIPASYEGYSATAIKALKVINEIETACCRLYGEVWDQDALKKKLEGVYKSSDIKPYYLELVSYLKMVYLKEDLLLNSKEKNLTAQRARDISGEISRIPSNVLPIPFVSPTLSKARLAGIRKRWKDATLKKVCRRYRLNEKHLNELSKINVTRVYIKPFVKEGVGFVLARIISLEGVTVVRGGVDESVSGEYAELVCLKRLSEVATKAGKEVEVVSGQLNIVDWLNKKTNVRIHTEIRDEILAWLEPLGYTSRRMTKEENKEYRAEKRASR